MKFPVIKKGATRWVIVCPKRAYKIPSLYSWKHFLQGLLANIQEAQWSGFDKRLCPVIFKLPLGFLVVMPTVEPIKTEDWYLPDDMYEALVNHEDYILPVENKTNSFGILNGEIVAIDYGS